MSENDKKSSGRLLYVPPKEEDIGKDDIKAYYKKYSKGGQKKEIPVPYIPQPKVHEFIAKYFGMNISIENLGYQLHEYTIEDSYSRTKAKKISVVRFFRLWFSLEIDGNTVDRFIDFAGACDIDNRTDFNQALHTAETSAFKELLKMIGKGLIAYERLDNEVYDLVQTIEEDAEPVNLDAVIEAIQKKT